MPAPRPVKYWATCFPTRFSLITPFQRELTWRRFAQTFPPKAKGLVEDVLTRDDRYKRAIEDVGLVPKLRPPERHRWIENRRQGEEWAKARNKAEGKSVLSQLFTRQTMLYGTRIIEYVDDFGGRKRRLDNRLRTISHTADNAMG